MPLYLLLLGNLRRQWTRSFSPRNRWLKVIGTALLATYIALVLISLGFLFTETVQRWAPGQDPVFLLNKHLLGIFFALFGIRFAVQRTSRMDIFRYLQLPIPRRKLVIFFQIASLANPHTLLPLLFFLPYWIRHFVVQRWPGDSPWTWLAGIVCLLMISHFLLMLVRTLSRRGMQVLLGGFVAATLLFAVGVLPLDRMTVVASLILFSGLRSGDLGMLLVLVGIMAVVFVFSSLRVRARIQEETRPAGPGWLASHVTFAARYGEILNLLLLEMQLIWRNRRPRSVFNYSLLFGTFPVVLLLLDRSHQSVSVFAILTALLASGSFAINYGQLMFSWESPYFDGFLMRRHDLRNIVYAKLLLLQASCGLFYVLSLPLFLGLVPHLAPLQFVMMVYNAGVNAILLLTLALYNDRRLDPQRAGVTNYEGFTLRHLLLFIPTMTPPIVVLYALRATPETALMVLFGLGFAGLLASGLWSNLLARRLAVRKYEMAYGFRRFDY